MKLVSIVFHPLLMATYTGALFYFIFPSFFSPIPYDLIPHFLGAMFVTTFVIPVLSILFLKLSKRISSLELEEREERILPFFTIAAFYGATTYIYSQKLQISSSIIMIMAITTGLILILGLISLKFKISIHAAAIWGVAGIATAVSQQFLDTTIIPFLCVVFLAAGITSTARLSLDKHSPVEVWTGSLLGFLWCYSGALIFV